jgi:hypothetical protein
MITDHRTDATRDANQAEGTTKHIFGAVKTKDGLWNGVWQRAANLNAALLLSAKGKSLRAPNKTAHLKLLIRFGNALPVKKHLRFGATAKHITVMNLGPEFEVALAKALATAR